MQRTWALITGEYPPQRGGVADYTRLLATALAADGDDVRVYAPPHDAPDAVEPGITVHRLSDHFGARGQRMLKHALADLPHPRAAVVQYVPQSFGMRGCNIPFARWLRTLRGYPLFVMFHEVSVTAVRGTPLKYRIQAFATRQMADAAIHAADAMFVSTPTWEPLLRRAMKEATPIDWTPVPSNVALTSDDGGRDAVRRQFEIEKDIVIGHFGSYREAFSRRRLTELVPRVLSGGRVMLFVGRGSTDFLAALEAEFPQFRGRMKATGGLPAQKLADTLSACDLVVQPFEDGISARRGSAIAPLALGIPLATTSGSSTEPIWRESHTVALAPSGSIDGLAKLVNFLADDAGERDELRIAGQALYARRFSIEHTTRTLRERCPA